MRAKFGVVPTAVSKIVSFKFISRCVLFYLIQKMNCILCYSYLHRQSSTLRGESFRFTNAHCIILSSEWGGNVTYFD